MLEIVDIGGHDCFRNVDDTVEGSRMIYFLEAGARN